MMLTLSHSIAWGGERHFINAPDSLFRIDFKWDSSAIDIDYRDNRSSITQLDKTIKSLNIESIDSIIIIAQASPEGVLEHNNALTRRRAGAMRKYMGDKYPELKPYIKVRTEGESWSQLRNYVVEDGKMSDAAKQRVLRILDNKDISVGTRKWRLERDAAFDYLYKTYYPKLRNSTLVVIYVDIEAVKPITTEYTPTYTIAPPRMTALAESSAAVAKREDIIASDTASDIASDIASDTASDIAEPSIVRDTMLFALKTNMLYDAVTALNAELEVPISRHFSVAVEYMFPWWERNNKYCLQVLELGVEGRYWFRNNKFKTQRLGGHFVGAYGMSAMYDIQNDFDPAYQGEFWSAGLTYGYAMPIGKKKRVNLEFALSVGYLSMGYRNYFPSSDYSELYINENGIGRIKYFGPTKLKVSLVVPINIGYNRKVGNR